MVPCKWLRAMRTVGRMLQARHAGEPDVWPSVEDAFLQALGLGRGDGAPVETATPITETCVIRASEEVVCAVCVGDGTVNCRGYRRVIIVSSKGTMPRKSIQCDGDAKLEVFHVLRLQLPVIDHEDFLPHRRLRPEETDRVMARFDTDASHLSKMFYGDPVARFFGWSVGDVIEITFHEDDDPKLTKRVKYRSIVPSPP
jgi:DNA-directed RNA polymerase subunit H (RpoH/RPB5)